jgi:hypothetical protein
MQSDHGTFGPRGDPGVAKAIAAQELSTVEAIPASLAI